MGRHATWEPDSLKPPRPTVGFVSATILCPDKRARQILSPMFLFPIDDFHLAFGL